LVNAVATVSMWSRHCASGVALNNCLMPLASAVLSGGSISARATATCASALASRRMRSTTAARTFFSMRVLMLGGDLRRRRFSSHY